MRWLRKNDTKLILAVMLLLTALLLVVSCRGGEDEPETALPATTTPAAVNSCLSCHADQQQLMALAVDEETVAAAEASGEG